MGTGAGANYFEAAEAASFAFFEDEALCVAFLAGAEAAAEAAGAAASAAKAPAANIEEAIRAARNLVIFYTFRKFEMPSHGGVAAIERVEP